MNPLHQAIEDGDLGAAKDAAKKVPVDFPDAGHRPLEYAIARSQAQIALWLLSQGADPNLSNAGNLTPLHRAAQRGQLDVVAALLSAGASVNAREWDDARTPLHLATLGSHAAIVRLLLGAGADPALMTVSGMTSVQAARRMADLRATGPKCQRATNTAQQVEDASLISGLSGAVALRDVAGVRRAISAGADLDQGCPWNMTPLIIAAALGEVDIVKLLVDGGADTKAIAWRLLPFERQRLGTASQWAQRLGHNRILAVLNG